MTKEAIEKIETFVKVALDEINDLRSALSLANKQAEEHSKAFNQSLQKAASAMYDSDFITDEADKELFVKRAQEDPAYMAKIIERVCKAADVSFMGKTANVAAAAQYEDPVMRIAFGTGSSYNLLDK